MDLKRYLSLSKVSRLQGSNGPISQVLTSLADLTQASDIWSSQMVLNQSSIDDVGEVLQHLPQRTQP